MATLPLVPTFLGPDKLKDNPEKYDEFLRDRWRQLATIVNGKSRSITSIYLRIEPAVMPVQIFRTVVGANTTLKVKQVSAVAITAGAGGANGLTLRLAGGSATLDINILPIAATTTDLGQATLLDYEVPASQVFTVAAQATDHTASPEDIMISLDCLYL